MKLFERLRACGRPLTGKSIIYVKRRNYKLNQFIRSEMLLGKHNIQKLLNSSVAIFGLGGVGSYTVEALARSGIGTFHLIDKDTVDITNLNRQILATHETIGQDKVSVAKKRILSINPNAKVHTHNIFYTTEDHDIFGENCNYIIDAIDTVSSKISLISSANKLNIPIISCMGTGNKLDPTQFEVSDIYKTSVCPLCRVMRHELKKRNIQKLKVVYSKEIPIKPIIDNLSFIKPVPGSVSFVPGVAGLIIAGEVIKDLLNCSD